MKSVTSPAAAGYQRSDFDHSPLLVFYEVTRACDLACLHCRASAQSHRDPEELSTVRSKALFEQLLQFPKPPLLVFTGGDPLKRPDVFALVRHAQDIGLKTAMTPSATPLVTLDALRQLRDSGLDRLAVSLDGRDAATHDSFRGVAGSFQRTLEILRQAKSLGLGLQVNTTVTRRNVDQIDAMAELLADFGIELWSVFFLVPVGRGLAEQRISPRQYEEVFERLWGHSRRQPYAIKTTEAHHYRRFVLERGGNPQSAPGGRPQRAPLGVNDGRGVMFVSHTGRIHPSGFLPADCGRFPDQSVVDIYQRHPIFAQLRDPDQLKGKCGACEFRNVCGGSRARAWALTGDFMQSDEDCAYVPVRWKEQTCPA